MSSVQIYCGTKDGRIRIIHRAVTPRDVNLLDVIIIITPYHFYSLIASFSNQKSSFASFVLTGE